MAIHVSAPSNASRYSSSDDTHDGTSSPVAGLSAPKLKPTPKPLEEHKPTSTSTLETEQSISRDQRIGVARTFSYFLPDSNSVERINAICERLTADGQKIKRAAILTDGRTAYLCSGPGEGGNGQWNLYIEKDAKLNGYPINTKDLEVVRDGGTLIVKTSQIGGCVFPRNPAEFAIVGGKLALMYPAEVGSRGDIPKPSDILSLGLGTVGYQQGADPEGHFLFVSKPYGYLPQVYGKLANGQELRLYVVTPNPTLPRSVFMSPIRAFIGSEEVAIDPDKTQVTFGANPRDWQGKIVSSNGTIIERNGSSISVNGKALTSVFRL